MTALQVVEQTPPTPRIAQTPQAPPAQATAGSAPVIYRAYRNKRSVLGDQLERLEDQRRGLAGQLREEPRPTGAEATGIEARIAQIDARIVELDKQIAVADAEVAQAAAIPGAIVEPAPPPRREGPPDEFYVLAGIFLFVVMLPLTIAYARRIWKRSAVAITTLPQELWERFARVEQGIDAMAVEVERIGEGQRFLTRMYSEQQRVLGAGPAQRVEVAEKEMERQPRK